MNVAVGLLVAEKIVSAQARGPNGETAIGPVHDIPVMNGLFDDPVAGAFLLAEPAEQRPP